MNEPIAWTNVETTIGNWIRDSTDFDVVNIRLVGQRETGIPRGPAPKVQFFLLSLVQRSKVGRIRYRQVQRQRYTVTATGPGVVGVDFFPDVSLTPQTIAYSAGIGELPASSAANLLIELQANLPAGYTASADPGDTASVLVDGSAAEPFFAALPLSAGANPAPPPADLPPITTVIDAIPNRSDLLVVEFRFVWRLDFRSAFTNGPSQAANAMMRCQVLREDRLDPAMRALGFHSEGTLATLTANTPDRVESTATYDVAFRGRMTLAVARTLGRAIGFDVQVQQAA